MSDHEEITRVRQIHKFNGRPIRIQLMDETVISGILVFYHFEDQVIHLQDWEVISGHKDADIRRLGGMNNGKFLIVNNTEWKFVFKE